jgi:phage portal protein BeeE
MAMIEIAQFTEARIAVLLGVPPFLVGLPSASGGSESMTYSNVSQIRDQHDQMCLKPAVTSVMPALSAWALPSTQQAELNRDEYSRPDFPTRAEAYTKLVAAGIMSVEEVRVAEQLVGETPEPVTEQFLSKPDLEDDVLLRRIS